MKLVTECATNFSQSSILHCDCGMEDMVVSMMTPVRTPATLFGAGAEVVGEGEQSPCEAGSILLPSRAVFR